MENEKGNPSLSSHGNVEELLSLHPLVTGKVVLRTGSIEELCKISYRTVILRQGGLYFTGKSGMGKTLALEYLVGYLCERMPKLRVVLNDGRYSKFPSRRAFYKFYLNSIGDERTSGETADLAIRLIRNFVDMARASGLNMIVLLIDEAQQMSFEDFDFLKDVGNQMARDGANLIPIFIAQSPEFTKVVDEIRSSGRVDLISRFVLRHNHFAGFTTAAQLENLFMKIDSEVWHEIPGVTWTEFFCEEAFRSGFRLANHAEEMFAVLLLETIDKKVEFPARQIFDALKEFLVDLSDSEFVGSEFDVQIWKNAVKKSAMNEILIQNKLNEPTKK